MDDLTFPSVATLVAAISDSNPCGDDLRADISPLSLYYQLRDLRSRARAAERQALVEEGTIAACSHEWRPLLERIPPLLTSHSKDLELVAWLIEALCRLHGFAGLERGFSLAAELIEQHWPELYPRADDGDIEVRLAPLIGLNGTDSEGALVVPITSIALTAGQQGPFSTWQLEQASDIARLDEKRQKARLQHGGQTLKAIQQDAQETPASFFVARARELAGAQQAFARLSAAMDHAAGSSQPASQISQALERCLSALRFLGGDKLNQAEVAAVVAAEPAAAAEDGSVAEVLDNRQQALRQLQAIAQFFRRTEPHSPISYVIDQAVRWSDLPLPQLLAELISDKDARKGYCRLTGIPLDE